MIRVTIKLVPHGIESGKRTLGVLEIANDGSGDARNGNYTGELTAEYTGNAPRTGRVTGFKRREQSAWSLVGAFLKLFGHTKHSPRLMEKT
ncbi:hypothetical protein [Roseiconus lacunae]|uniref:hypothetical protein n=1 Tax=Roseiconus lacunae TaxID=2605694 RepID=UPI001E3A121D|nr:hypothetical protein [Roseiconus lacunae]MCD0459155.1 hypothetical protein [Roseiconus lacunae]